MYFFFCDFCYHSVHILPLYWRTPLYVWNKKEFSHLPPIYCLLKFPEKSCLSGNNLSFSVCFLLFFLFFFNLDIYILWSVMSVLSWTVCPVPNCKIRGRHLVPKSVYCHTYIMYLSFIFTNAVLQWPVLSWNVIVFWKERTKETLV